MSKFLPFVEALAVARSLNLANQFEWQQWCKEGMRPPNVPSTPNRTYKDGGWQGWGHWLGTGNQHTKEFLPFGEALAVARSLGLANQFEWQQWCKEGMRPPNVPSNPNATYKDGGWQGWGHWLGTGNVKTDKRQFLPFGEALAVARSLGLASSTEWKVWSKQDLRPLNVPANPQQTYKDGGWQGWGHWLGTGNQCSRMKEFLPFDEALPVARSLNLASSTEWNAWCKEGMRPPNVPSNPHHTYKDGGWQGWVHWLGTGGIQKAGKFAPFGQTLAFARTLGLANQKEWFAWCEKGMRPANVPARPDDTYAHNGWTGWAHWLGSSGVEKASKFAPFNQALAFARSLNLASSQEWQQWCRKGLRPPNVPSTPGATYKDGGWKGWGH